MDLAINYSNVTVDLLRNHQIQIDYLKTPDWDWMIEAALQIRPVAVHFNLVAGDRKINKTNWDHITHCLLRTGTPYINMHLEVREEDFPGIPVDTVDESHIEQICEQMITDISTVTGIFGTEKVIIENVPYRAENGSILRPCVEPHVIQRIVNETGCGLLFDLSHARISAHYLGMPQESYIAALPLASMREMHFTGIQQINGKLEDHLAAQDNDWIALDAIIQKIKARTIPIPWLLAFEYGGVGENFTWRSDPRVVKSQTPKLFAITKSIAQ